MADEPKKKGWTREIIMGVLTTLVAGGIVVTIKQQWDLTLEMRELQRQNQLQWHTLQEQAHELRNHAVDAEYLKTVQSNIVLPSLGVTAIAARPPVTDTPETGTGETGTGETGTGGTAPDKPVMPTGGDDPKKNPKAPRTPAGVVIPKDWAKAILQWREHTANSKVYGDDHLAILSELANNPDALKDPKVRAKYEAALRAYDARQQMQQQAIPVVPR
jgi:hypothetical protein